MLKNKCYIVLLFGLFLVIQGYSQTFVLPDSNFRKCLQARYTAVLNTGGQLITAEAAKLTGTFACINQKITNADGIQYFTSLSVLQLTNNNISYIPSLVDLKNLVELDLSENQLTTLPDISKLSKLKSLSVEQNDLIALPDLSTNNLIDNLIAHNNNLTNLPNLDKLTKLSYINVSYNKLSALPNLDKLTSLTSLYCWVNELTSLPRLDSLKNLRNLHVFLNKLTVAPTLPKNNKIESVFINDNKISTLVDYSANSSLVKVRLYNNYGLSFKEYFKLTTKSGYDTIFKLSPQQKLVVGKMQNAHENDTVYLSTGIDKGVAGVRYDWFKNGTFYKSATNDLLAIPKCTFADSGFYACHIRHSAFAGFSLATDSFKVNILPCVEFKDFTITSTEINCLNTGTITISGDQSRISSFELKGINSGKIQTSTTGKFVGLSEPVYKLKAIAQNGCFKEYANSIIINQKECEEAILSPDGDGLSDHYFFPENGKVTIYDKFGKTIKTLTIPAEWNGTSEKGIVPMGFYVADVNNGKRFVGITVLY